MNTLMKATAAIGLALVTVLPAGAALAAGQYTTKQMTAKPMAVTDPSGMVGHWTAADISALDGAKSVKIIDLRKAYGSKDRDRIAAVEKADKAQIAKLHTALNSDSKFKAWAKKNHINVDRVVGVSNGEVAVF